MSDPHEKLLNQLAATERQRDDAEARAASASGRVKYLERALAEAEADVGLWRERAANWAAPDAELAKARAEVEALRAQLSEWATRCGAAETEARELREGRATWTVGDDGVRRLVLRRVVDEEVGEVSPGADPARVTYAYADGRVSGTGSHYDPTREPAHVLSHAQRIVEMLTGVKP